MQSTATLFSYVASHRYQYHSLTQRWSEWNGKSCTVCTCSKYLKNLIDFTIINAIRFEQGVGILNFVVHFDTVATQLWIRGWRKFTTSMQMNYKWRKLTGLELETIQWWWNSWRRGGGIFLYLFNCHQFGFLMRQNDNHHTTPSQQKGEGECWFVIV